MLFRVLVALGSTLSSEINQGQHILFHKSESTQFENCQKGVLTLNLALLVYCWVPQEKTGCMCMCMYACCIYYLYTHTHTHCHCESTLLTIVTILKLLQVGPAQFLMERRIHFLGCYGKIDCSILQFIKCLCLVLGTQLNTVPQNRVLAPVFFVLCCSMTFYWQPVMVFHLLFFVLGSACAGYSLWGPCVSLFYLDLYNSCQICFICKKSYNGKGRTEFCSKYYSNLLKSFMSSDVSDAICLSSIRS